MMLRDIDQFFWDKPEPAKSCMEALRHFVLQYHPGMVEEWKYAMPFYRFQGKRLCYIWAEKKTGRPYLGIVDGNMIDHPFLIPEKRSRMKIFLLDPASDLPVEMLAEILDMAIAQL
ncbi:DUF1801 domain-containing protein [Dyadobacter arcticus]|uniref:YdhG-like domain-containing protein n=1 Tax=Dyadobacter arcticus TaxID=1078754 RepID=A0ABX0UJN5_9BACT|nr:DUF1801 domain-containing protein [Dyadobacter arcticus]NIJ53127.1 hypothetical protein [Dyadobacter arcticus]